MVFVLRVRGKSGHLPLKKEVVCVEQSLMLGLGTCRAKISHSTFTMGGVGLSGHLPIHTHLRPHVFSVHQSTIRISLFLFRVLAVEQTHLFLHFILLVCLSKLNSTSFHDGKPPFSASQTKSVRRRYLGPGSLSSDGFLRGTCDPIERPSGTIMEEKFEGCVWYCF